MKEVGHFPMSENPAQFRRYILPDSRRDQAGARLTAGGARSCAARDATRAALSAARADRSTDTRLPPIRATAQSGAGAAAASRCISISRLSSKHLAAVAVERGVLRQLLDRFREHGHDRIRLAIVELVVAPAMVVRNRVLNHPVDVVTGLRRQSIQDRAARGLAGAASMHAAASAAANVNESTLQERSDRMGISLRIVRGRSRPQRSPRTDREDRTDSRALRQPRRWYSTSIEHARGAGRGRPLEGSGQRCRCIPAVSLAAARRTRRARRAPVRGRRRLQRAPRSLFAWARPSSPSQARSWPHRLGPCTISSTVQVASSTLRPPHPHSTMKPDGERA